MRAHAITTIASCEQSRTRKRRRARTGRRDGGRGEVTDRCARRRARPRRRRARSASRRAAPRRARSRGGSSASDTTPRPRQASRALRAARAPLGAHARRHGPRIRSLRPLQTPLPPRVRTGVASSKPAFFPSSTPGVASACRPRNAALARNASETRRRRRRAPPRRGSDGGADRDACERRGEDEPEVGGVVLPALVDRRLRQHDDPEHGRDESRRDPELHGAVISRTWRPVQERRGTRGIVPSREYAALPGVLGEQGQQRREEVMNDKKQTKKKQGLKLECLASRP